MRQKVSKDRATFVFVCLSILGSALNYIAYPVLARLLPNSQYVDITVALSLLTQISTFMSSLVAVTIGLSKVQENGEKIVSRLQTYLLQLFALLGIIFLVLSPIIMSKINTPTIYALPIAVMIILSIPITIMSGYLNGRQQMVKLGLVVIITASIQFVAGATCAYLTKNGALTMIGMGLTQLLSISLLIFLFRNEKLPAITKGLFQLRLPSVAIRNILIYTIVASVAVMAINLLQVVDLLAINNLEAADAKTYTDIYIVSRIVFFAGMIFIWPFLGSLRPESLRHNLIEFGKLFCLLAIIAGGIIIGLVAVGEPLYSLAFGRTLQLSQTLPIISLSIFYKLLLLYLTAIVLYLIVIRSYRCVIASFISVLFVLLLPSIVTSSPRSVVDVLGPLVLGALLSAIVSGILVAFPSRRRIAIIPQLKDQDS